MAITQQGIERFSPIHSDSSAAAGELQAQASMAANNENVGLWTAFAQGDTYETGGRLESISSPNVLSPEQIRGQLLALTKEENWVNTHVDDKSKREALLQRITHMREALDKENTDIHKRQETYMSKLTEASKELMGLYKAMPIGFGYGATMWSEWRKIRLEIGKINAVIAQGLQPDFESKFATHDDIIQSPKFQYMAIYGVMKLSQKQFDAYIATLGRHVHKVKNTVESFNSANTARTALFTNVMKGAMSWLPGSSSSSSSDNSHGQLASALQQMRYAS